LYQLDGHVSPGIANSGSADRDAGWHDPVPRQRHRDRRVQWCNSDPVQPASGRDFRFNPMLRWGRVFGLFVDTYGRTGFKRLHGDFYR
jgi:hypothetical protein